MASTIGQPLMGYPDSTSGSGYYYHLGCGDIETGTSEFPGTFVCPVHGNQQVVKQAVISYDGTSAPRSC